ncbi:MAG TPA: protein translocase subunit SecD, partial [Acidimicrobiia bacterium]|nr:protein translocase subunit SecD [Acidimicrobiia bacterium]
MPKVSRWRLFLTVMSIGAAVYIVLNNPINLGLDLRGGTQIVLEAQDTPEVTVDSEVTGRTLEVLRRRVDAFGVSEPTLQISGDRRIIIELPGLDDPDQALEVIGRTAQLTFHPVLDSVPTGTAAEDDDALVLPGELGEDVVLGPAALTGDEVESALSIFDSQGSGLWAVSIDFRPDGEQAWAELTAEAACYPQGDPRRRVAIVLDDTILSSPSVSPSVQCDVGITGGGTLITGNFDEDSAGELALLVRAGALPVPVVVIEQGTIGPSLGEAAIAASLQAALIGAGLTIIYMVAYYRLMGAAAALSLGVYALLSYAVLAWMGATLTLPGIAGFVLAIGMAVDANVLVYERAKEEYALEPSLGSSILAGFQRAWSAIADANVTTLLAAILLFFFASGAVRGFGVTLTVGVLVSMFSALVVTRVLLELLARIPALQARPNLMGMSVGRRLQNWLKTSGLNLFANPRRWLVISGIAVLIAIAGAIVQGLNFGLEFLGGRLVEFSTTQTVDLEELRQDLTDLGLPRALIQETGEGNVVIRTEQLDADQEQLLEDTVAGIGGEVTVVRDQFVGPTLGREIRNRALIALGLALLLQLGYLAIRFRWTIGLAAVAAMFHDVIIVIGVFAWLGRTLDGVFLAALLTVIGYSINDSVVIFDRIREQRAARPDEPLSRIANDACLQTVPRTINTGLGAMMILLALFFLGGDTLADFALDLLIGILIGTYSSVFTATPIAIALEDRFPGPPPEPVSKDTRRPHDKQKPKSGDR